MAINIEWDRRENLLDEIFEAPGEVGRLRIIVGIVPLENNVGWRVYFTPTPDYNDKVVLSSPERGLRKTNAVAVANKIVQALLLNKDLAFQQIKQGML